MARPFDRAYNNGSGGRIAQHGRHGLEAFQHRSRSARPACPAGTAPVLLEVPCAAFLWHLCAVGDVGNLGLDFLDHIAVPAQLLKFVGEFGKFGAAGHLGRELVQG